MAGKNGNKGKKNKPSTPSRGSAKKPSAPRKAFNKKTVQPLSGDIDELMRSVVIDDADGVKAFLKKYPGCADVRDTDDGTTALYNCAIWGHDDAAQALLEGGADPDLAGPDRITPLMKAAERGHDSTVSLLVAHSAKLDLQDEDGDTALIYATQSGREEVVRALLDAGADATIANNDGLTALAVARDYERDEIIELINAAAEKRARERAVQEEARRAAESKNVLNKIQTHKPASGNVFNKNNKKPPQP